MPAVNSAPEVVMTPELRREHLPPEGWYGSECAVEIPQRCVCTVESIDGLTALVGASGIFLAMLGCVMFGYGLGRVRRIRARIGGAR